MEIKEGVNAEMERSRWQECKFRSSKSRTACSVQLVSVVIGSLLPENRGRSPLIHKLQYLTDCVLLARI